MKRTSCHQQQCELTVLLIPSKMNCVMSYIGRKSVASRWRKAVSLCLALEGPAPVTLCRELATQFKRHVEKLKADQWMLPGWWGSRAHRSPGKMVGSGLIYCGQEDTEGYSVAAYGFLKGCYKHDGDSLFPLVSDNISRDNCWTWGDPPCLKGWCKPGPADRGGEEAPSLDICRTWLQQAPPLWAGAGEGPALSRCLD